MGWQNHGTPYSNADKIGIPYQECQICGYSSSKKPQTYNASKDQMEDASWTQSTDLVYVEGGYASCDIVVNGTKLVIGFTPSEYAKKELIGLKNPTVTGWKVRYLCDRSPAGSVIDADVTKDFSFTKIENELKWRLTVPLFSQRKGGGILIFTPVVEECKHNAGTRIKNASEPICTKDGYTGDTVCAGCDGVIFYGEVIESSHKHEGNLTLIPGTSKAGTCTQRGYEGTYRCDHCNQKVRGKTTAKQHSGKTVTKNAVAVTCTKFGYSGDIYCECGLLLQEGEVLTPRHTDLKLINAVKANCQKKGYTGDWYCSACKQTVKYGYNIAKTDHAWSKWGKITDLSHRHTCVVAGCGAQETSVHTDADRNLVCDGCGYSWAPNGNLIKAVVFNIDVPEIGAKPDYTKFDGASYASQGTSTYQKNGVEWFDVTNNKRFVPGGVNQEFKEGNVYKVTIHFRVKGSYEFADEGVLTAAINGKNATVEYVTYGEFAGISYTFPALVHKHTMTRTDKVSPTCTQPGKQTYYHCDGCSKYFEDAAGKKVIADISAWGNLPANGHKASELKTNSTHHFKVCTVCYTEIAGSKAAHSGGKATCQEKAKCTACGVEYGALAAHSFGTAWDYQTATGHAHTCTTPGCGVHDQVKTHDPAAPATQTTAEVCKSCAYVLAAALNHTHSLKAVAAVSATCTADGNIAYYTCSCGKYFSDSAGKNELPGKQSVVVKALGHKYAPATCTAPATCVRCSATTGAAAGHKYSTQWNRDKDGHWHSCSACLAAEKKTAHKPGPAATDTEDQVCTDCGYVLQLALKHTHKYSGGWFSDTANHWHACGCGEKADIQKHTDTNGDSLCDACTFQMPYVSQPDDPTAATNPASPDVPVDPSAPADPDASADPSAPADPDAPTPSGDAADPTAQTDPTGAPQGTKGGRSGGVTAGIISAVVIVLGGGGFALYWFVFRKKEEPQA